MPQPWLVVHFKQRDRKDDCSPWESGECLQVSSVCYSWRTRNPIQLEAVIRIWPFGQNSWGFPAREALAKACLSGKSFQTSYFVPIHWPYFLPLPSCWSNSVTLHIPLGGLLSSVLPGLDTRVNTFIFKYSGCLFYRRNVVLKEVQR